MQKLFEEQGRRLKRLDLQCWQRGVLDAGISSLEELDRWSPGLRKIKPVVGKTGWYFLRTWCKGHSWFENGEEAYWSPKLAGYFAEELKMLDHVPWSDSARRAYVSMKDEHLVDRRLRNMYYIDTCWRDLRDMLRDMRKWRASVLGKER